ncbi:MAG: LytR C-terminal domain-containing protein [bacterium]|nr:LytR C-terminal domain-containing protein [bacterium]
MNRDREKRVRKLPRRFKTKKKSVVSYWLLIIGLLVFGVLFFRTWQVFAGSKWDGNSRLTLGVSGKKVVLATFSPRDEELLFLLLPQDTYLEVIHGYGRYRAEAVLSLGEQEKQKDLFADSLQENFGLPVDGWMTSQAEREPIDEEEAKKIFLEDLTSKILRNGETNLTTWDLVRLWWQVKNLRFDKTKVLYLGKYSVLVNKPMADQSRAWTIDKVMFDTKMAKLFSEPQIRDENLGMEILNGTDYSGLGEKAARILSNMGGEVVLVGNSGERIKKSKVKSKKADRNSFTVKKVLKIFDGKWEEKTEEGRAEVTLILGDDYWQKLNQK